MSDTLTLLVRKAQAAYETGNFGEAIATQQRAIAEAARLSQSTAQHYLALAMFLFECADYPNALDWLQKAAAIWPANPQVVENSGVLLVCLGRHEEAKAEFERAMTLGSESLNVLDGLCHCLGRLKDFSGMQHYGRRVLEAKNKASLAVGTRHPLPSRPLPRFDPTQQKKNVISYCLWGNDPRYIVPLLENLKLAPHLFSGWTIRIYFDKSVPDNVLSDLRKSGGQLIDKSSESEVTFYTRRLWRFEVANDSSVQRFLVRDADSILSVKERVAVDAWLASDAYFHVMRDFYTHTDLMLAGMWGGVANILPDLKKLWHAYQTSKMQGRTADQRFLNDMVWPTVSQSCLMHDSVFTGCLGSVPFPPYGDLMPGHHIGQNAFRYFRQN